MAFFCLAAACTVVEFRFPIFLVAKCAFPNDEKLQGFCRLAPFVYSSAGFQEDGLRSAAKPIHQYMHLKSKKDTCGKFSLSRPVIPVLIATTIW